MGSQQKKKRLKAKADRLYQEIGRAIYKKCLVCGGEYSCLHHYIPKSRSYNLRYNIKNGIPLCANCHFDIHKRYDPRVITKIVKIKGIDWLEEIEAEARKIQSDTIEHLENTIRLLNSITKV